MRLAGLNKFRIGNSGVGEGNSTPADIRSGKTASTDIGDIVGSMPENGPVSAETINLTSEGQEYTIPLGFHSGLRKIKAVISGLVAGVIKAGVNVGGITGTFTNDALLDPQYLLQGYSGYDDGVLKTGTMPNRGAVAITPSASNQVISEGYHNGSGIVSGVPVPVDKVLEGTTIAGQAGTMPNKVGIVNATGAAQWGDGSLAVYLEGGSYNWNAASELQVSQAQLQAAEPDLIASNIRDGTDMWGVIGTLEPFNYAEGSATVEWTRYSSSNVWYTASLTVNGLTFKPKFILVYVDSVYSNLRLMGNILFSDPSVNMNKTVECYDSSPAGYWRLQSDGTTTYVQGGFTCGLRVSGPSGVYYSTDPSSTVKWLAIGG